jgi:hypothetical protein
VKALDDGFDLVAVLIPQTILYTASSTWTKPANLVYAEVQVSGGGGGGGGAGATTANQAAAAGGGGGGAWAL